MCNPKCKNNKKNFFGFLKISNSQLLQYQKITTNEVVLEHNASFSMLSSLSSTHVQASRLHTFVSDVRHHKVHMMIPWYHADVLIFFDLLTFVLFHDDSYLCCIEVIIDVCFLCALRLPKTQLENCKDHLYCIPTLSFEGPYFLFVNEDICKCFISFGPDIF